MASKLGIINSATNDMINVQQQSVNPTVCTEPDNDKLWQYTDDLMMCTEPDNDKPWLGWRHLPDVDGDLMIISSYGSTVRPQNVKVAEKLVPSDRNTTDRLVLAREELDCIFDLYKQDKKYRIVYCYCEHGTGLQMSKDYYLQRMRKFLTESERKIAGLFYTGDSEEGTGNWCFKDGVITFQDIYGIYNECFKGKRLTVFSDCSYSGNWIKECVKVYDRQGILPCGHHSRERGILVKLYTSCKSFQQATILAYVKEAMTLVVNEVIYWYGKNLSSRLGQTTASGDFTKIRCDSRPDEQCQYTTADPPYTWENRILLCNRVYIVRGKDKGKPCWQVALIDEEKEEAAFKATDKIKTGTINVADYGKILYSGWGKNPPEDIKQKIDKHFNCLKVQSY